MNAFRHQTAVITGATGSVGGAIAARIVASGGTVVLLGRSRDALDRAVQAHRLDAASVKYCVADLAVEAQISEAAGTIAEFAPNVHVLVHSAGVYSHAAIETSEPGEFDRQYSINLRAPYQLTRALLPALISAQGQVVFVNSSVGLKAGKGVAQYAATKHGLRAIADSLRDEVNDRGIRVLSVYLGRTASRMQAMVHEQEGRVYQPQRLLQAGDVATMVEAALLLPRTAEVTDLHIRQMLKL